MSTFVFPYYVLTVLQIRRGGRWNSDQMTGCYLTTLPRKFMRGMAQFPPKYPAAYFIPRATIEPSYDLSSRVWPQLDQWKHSYELYPKTMDQSLAAGAFLELMQKLRVVFLQVEIFFFIITTTVTKSNCS